MTGQELAEELERLGNKWEDYRRDLDGMSGSPGEWMVEQMGEIETEQRRRGK